jgi:L-fucose isomerase-like protein
MNNFLAVCNVVKAFRNTRILQISTRPYDFLTTMCNEGELLERFNINLAPISMPELTAKVKKVRENSAKINETLDYIRKSMDVQIKDNELESVAALKIAMEELAEQYGCNAVAIQCWNYLQCEIGIMPCTANSLLTDEGLPVVCETDIHGAITSIMVEAAGMGRTKSFFADWTVRHPDNENAELLQHCGPWPLSIAKNKPILGYPLAFEHPGSVSAESKHGNITLARFDGDNGEYSLLLGNAKAVEGPYTMGTYLWVEVENLDRLEDKLCAVPIFITVQVFIWTLCRCFMKPVNTLISSLTSMITLKIELKLLYEVKLYNE